MINRIKEFYKKYEDNKKEKDLNNIINHFYVMIEIFNHRKKNQDRNKFFSQTEKLKNEYIDFFRNFKPNFERKYQYTDLPLDIRHFFESL
jgi:hypothetical protein